jgi:hypothetical protein
MRILSRPSLKSASHAFHQTATAQGCTAAGFGADRNESVSSISGGDRGCAKALGAPADRDVCDTGFSCSLSHVIEIAWFYGSSGVRCDITEIRVTCHDLLGIGDRMRGRAALSYSHRFRQCWQDVAISVFGMAAPRICHARGLRDMGAPSPG